MTRKGKMPTHIQAKTFHHPQEDLRIIQILNAVPDPRKPSCNFQYSLTSILFIVVVGVLCGADDWVGIAELAISMKGWLGQFVDVSSGIPSACTMERVLSLVDPEAMEGMLIETMKILTQKAGGIVSFDGKSLRGSLDESKKAIHLLNAWSAENKICIGHKKVDEKSNEITAMPELMDLLDLRGTIITADALNTQKTIAGKAIEKGADYILPVKGNHKSLLEDIECIFKDAEKRGFKGVDSDEYETLEKSRGRVEKRSYRSICVDELPNKSDWEGVKSLGMVERERTDKGKTAHERIFYISSCEIDAQLFARGVRDHWQVGKWTALVIRRNSKRG